MKRVLAVVCILVGLLFILPGIYFLSFIVSPDYETFWSEPLMGVLLLSASVFCFVAARLLWGSDKK
jgi:hypothetical protein